ncbi:MAG TPA: universal stress protein [Mycobacteriales bacterium]|nr:universal stress protein [Mycobacteriales bacterium]
MTTCHDIYDDSHPMHSTTRVVVGVDGSDPSKTALQWAARIAPSLGATLEAVIAWDYPTNYGWAVGIPENWRPDIDATKVLEATLDEVFDAHRPPDLLALTRQGQASSVLLEASRGADMLVVGSRGHGGFTGLLLGSVSASCAEHAHCPVLVAHGQPNAGPTP